jgi:DNA-binding SARP family transcriptional activator
MLVIRLLGPAEARVCQQPVSLSPLQTNLLALLALSPGTVVSTERLVDWLWGDRPPAVPRSRVQGLVSELRRKVGDVLVTRHPGYLLDPRGYSTDVQQLDDLVRQARQAGDPAEVSEALHAALALWRGDPLDGVSAPGVDADRIRLAELQMSVQEDLFEVELNLGHHAELVAELTAAVAAHPLRERLAGQLMLALFRGNRQADALRVYQDLRDRLVEDVGSEPCADLRRLHAEILRGEAEHPEHSMRPAPLVRPTRPAQLPAGVGHFTGRDAELAELNRAVAGAAWNTIFARTASDSAAVVRAASDSAAVVRAASDPAAVVVVSGLGGLGKTALAVHWARAHADRFPDGQIFVDLHGQDRRRTLSARGALAAVLTALGVARADLPPDQDERAALYRTLISARRVLLVADDALTADQLLPLVPPTPRSQLLVTSRGRLTALSTQHAMHLVVLPALSPRSTSELLERIVGRDRLRERAVADIVRWCAGYPPAVRMVAAKLLARPGQSLASFTEELGDDLLDGDVPGVREGLSAAYRSLSPAAAHLFGRLGLSGGTSLQVATTPDPTGRRVRQLFDELVSANLVVEDGPGCYGFPPVVRGFARECGAHLLDHDVVDAWMRHRHPVAID